MVALDFSWVLTVLSHMLAEKRGVDEEPEEADTLVSRRPRQRRSTIHSTPT